ncbi:hypothetical protein [Modestobacter roseus]|uniref:Uncharacterized protein n=1 Tax=Modestobacter roseus TaxID=1181884 RepID=A0A562IQQ7_9ACTN|nr:hypothetical protein [Modestobacter roseus]MQA34355.1 hypothetical protein [Modestobacter roseus]TWH72924.1 hypothetical protein JD78_01447 [Modestobacter roseus]
MDTPRPQHLAAHELDRPVADIAGLIIDDLTWHERPIPAAAEPYLHTMLGLSTSDLRDRYGHARVADVVRGALDALDGWTSPTAVHVRHELRAALLAADETTPHRT